MRRTVAWMVLAAALMWAAALVVAPRMLAAEERAAGRSATGPTATGPSVSAPSVSRRSVAAAIYVGASFLCHQRPERSFQAADRPFPVCARCTGLYVGAPLGLAGVLLLWRRRAPVRSAGPGRDAGADPEIAAAGRTYSWWRWALGLAAVPTVLSIGIEQVFGLSCNSSRALTAVPLGAAVAALVGAALVAGRDAEPSVTLPLRRVPHGRADRVD